MAHTQDEVLAGLAELRLDATDQAAFLGGTAREVFGLT